VGYKIFPYILIHEVQAKSCWIRQELLYLCQLPSVSFLSCLDDLVIPPKAVILDVESSALKRTRRPRNVVVFFFGCIVWLTGSLRPMVLSHVNEFNTFFKITLIKHEILYSQGFVPILFFSLVTSKESSDLATLKNLLLYYH